MRMKSGWALGFVVLPLAALMGCSNSKSTSSNGFVWVATQGDQSLTTYAVSLSNGAASKVGSPVATGVQPAALAISPDRKTLFLVNTADNTVGVYTVNSDQSLKPASPATIQLKGTNPVALGVDPSGKFLFVANQGIFSNNTSGTISVINLGTLAEVSGSPFLTEVAGDATSTGPTAVVASPAGNFLYVANQFTNTVQQFSYDPNSGVLSPPLAYAAGTNPSGLAFSRCAGITSATTSCSAADANTLFVANAGSNDISAFTACIQVTPTCAAANGTLLPVTGSPVPAGLSPNSFIVNPVSNFVYAVDSKSNQISQYSYNTATGALNALTPAAVSTGASPGFGGITSDGSFVLVPDTGASTMSVYHANSVTSSTGTPPNGRLSPASTPSVPLSGQASVLLVR